MAIASYINPSAQGAVFKRFAGIIENLQARLARRKLFYRTLSELNRLSERELADLGLHRSMIRGIAWQAAYEN